jgi:hypothetical protein
MAKEKTNPESKYIVIQGKEKNGGDYSHKFLKSYLETLTEKQIMELYKKTYSGEVIAEVLKKLKEAKEEPKKEADDDKK